MKEEELAARLKREGFTHTYAWEDGPNTTYAAHKHPFSTANIILTGEVTITMAGKSNTYRAGDRCDIDANTVHSAVMGPCGCRYLVGER
jgi:mannose-6-phosphate isomerase-like protein (cupin superfamily)